MVAYLWHQATLLCRGRWDAGRKWVRGGRVPCVLGWEGAAALPTFTPVIYTFESLSSTFEPLLRAPIDTCGIGSAKTFATAAANV